MSVKDFKVVVDTTGDVYDDEITDSDGMIGPNFLQELPMEIDYIKGIATVYSIEEFRKRESIEGSITIPITYTQKTLPYIDGTINGVKRRFAVNLSEAKSYASRSGSAAISTRNNPVILRAMGGIKAGMLVADTISFGGITVRGVPLLTPIPGQEDPIVWRSGAEGEFDVLGADIWERFIVLLNLSELKLSLRPNPSWKESRTRRTGVGAVCGYRSGTLPWVRIVVVPSSAASAGVAVEDQVEAVNGKPLKGLTVAQQCRLLEDLKPGRYRFRIRAKSTGKVRTVSLLSKVSKQLY